MRATPEELGLTYEELDTYARRRAFLTALFKRIDDLTHELSRVPSARDYLIERRTELIRMVVTDTPAVDEEE